MNVLITGCSRGIGLQMVKMAVLQRWRVFACCRNPQQAAKLMEVAQMSAGLVSVHILDLSEPATIQALAYELRNEPLDMLINNAGVYGSLNNQWGAVDTADWQKTFAINTIAPYQVSQAFLPNLHMGEKKLIAMLSSKMGSMSDNTSGGCYIYRSSKAALNSVVKSMSVDLSEYGITILAMHPGWVKTDMGGPNAEISTRESVQQLFDSMQRATSADSGQFLDIDGCIIPW